jgi:hypothetical protein
MNYFSNEEGLGKKINGKLKCYVLPLFSVSIKPIQILPI